MLRVHPIDPIPSEGSHHVYHAVAYPLHAVAPIRPVAFLLIPL
jgi:hypothetical protein